MTSFEQAQSLFYDTVYKNGMLSEMKKGCLIGLSGGADSVLLTLLMRELSVREGFPIACLHVHHGIRGEEAERDLAFSRELCQDLCVPFEERRICVPAVASETGESVEQAARRMRYALLCEVAGEKSLGAVLTAHHASDSAESVLLNLARGTGAKGLCGIPPVRQEGKTLVLRPLIALSRTQVVDALCERGVAYVSDSTNKDTAYRRNFVREELVPRFISVNPSFERAVYRMSESLRSDMDYLDEVAMKRYEACVTGEKIPTDALLSMHPAVRYRVLLLLYKHSFPEAPLPERVHIDALLTGLGEKGNFITSFPMGSSAIVKDGFVAFGKDALPFRHKITKVTMGETVLSDGGKILVLEKGFLPSSANVYKMSIRRDLSSATINGDMYVRARENGDAYRFGGVTHKLKKLFSDAHISTVEREHIPILCDSEGILWVPHFGVRDDGGEAKQRDLTVWYIPPMI